MDNRIVLGLRSITLRPRHVAIGTAQEEDPVLLAFLDRLVSIHLQIVVPDLHATSAVHPVRQQVFHQVDAPVSIRPEEREGSPWLN